DFMAMATGQADAMKLFSSGKLKISGDVMASQKLGFLKKLTPEMVLAETKKRGGGANSAGADVPPVAADFTPTVDDVFAVIEEYLKTNTDLAGKVGKSYQWKIGDHRWLLDLKSGSGGVKKGEDKADCTLELTEEDFLALTQGKADAMKLFTTGKLKISGDVMASQKLQFLSKLDPGKAIEVVQKRHAGGAATASPAPAAAAKATGPAHAEKFFAALDKRLSENKNLAGEVRAKVTFKVTDPAFEKTYDLGGTSVTTLTIKDADLAQLSAGNAKSLYQHGQLRVDGDVSVAHRLGFLKGL
ncbi:MAG: SCP2 sterol-binding domain-containing protein, partial [Deltaproteobacteria bacterium]